jgi:hypothetical protein
LTLRDLTHQALASLGKRDDGRCQTAALWIGDNGWFPAFHDGDNRVCGAEIDADDFAHKRVLTR